MRYRYFCKLLEKDFNPNGRATMLAVAPVCKLKLATNFALFLGYSLSSELNARVLLVDTNINLTRKTLSARLDAKNRAGFFQLALGEETNLDDQIVETPVKNVFLLPSGAKAEMVRAIIDRDQLASLCKDIATAVDYVIFLQDDIRVDTRYIGLSNLVDMNLLLVQKDSTLLSDIDECQKLYTDNEISSFRLVMTSA